jgi:glycosyltransferase involved in cell wall biosynthesis
LKVLYVTSNGGIHDYRFLKKLVQDYDVVLLHYSSGELIDEVKNIKGLKIISKRPVVKPFPLLSEYFHFKKTYNSFKPDIVHSGYVWQVGILASLLNVHPHLSMPWGSDILFEPDESIIKKMLVRKVMNQCDHIQCDAEFVKNKIIKDYNVPKDKVTVFPWGIDLKLFNPADKVSCRKALNIDNEKFVVVFTRQLKPVYGINDLLEGFKIFCRNKDDVLLLMVSDGDLKNDVKKFIVQNELDKKINLMGPMPNSQLPGILSASDVYISPSMSDGTSLSLLEAMAEGLGLIVTDVPAIREWVSEKNGLIVQKKKPGMIAEALEKYYLDRNLILSHGATNIKITAERADWDKNYLMLKEIFKNLVKQNQEIARN